MNIVELGFLYRSESRFNDMAKTAANLLALPRTEWIVPGYKIN